MRNENITKAAQTADLLLSDLRAAHHASLNRERPDAPQSLLELALFGVLEDAARLCRRVNEIYRAVEAEKGNR